MKTKLFPIVGLILITVCAAVMTGCEPDLILRKGSIKHEL